MNRALNLISKRAETGETERLSETFVDFGVSVALESLDHQIVYGRRGTGKTHALLYLQTVVLQKGDLPIYVDLRTIGSPGGLFGAYELSPFERATHLLADLVMTIHDSLLQAVIDDDSLVGDPSFVSDLDALQHSISGMKIVGDVERTSEGEVTESKTSKKSVGATLGKEVSAKADLGSDSAASNREKSNVVQRGREVSAINFGDVATSLRRIMDALVPKRVWLLLDEWSSVPLDIQPLLGEFIVRCLLSLRNFTTKIGAIEQQSAFRSVVNGEYIGIEVGADVTANLNLDDFMVFDQSEDRSREFFRGLFYNHLSSGDEVVPKLDSEKDVVRLGFTDKRAFDELVRAAEGVPRDALNIAAKAAIRAAAKKISVDDVRNSASQWFQSDKEANLRSRPEAAQLLHWIIDKVIRDKRARGFMVSQRVEGAEILLGLFDARVLHILRRGYSAKDEPGHRYMVYSIDYGAYVDLMNTKSAPLGLFEIEEKNHVDVPPHDLRSLRRTILDLPSFLEKIEREKDDQ
ncbi:hypothetical protein AB0L41_38315 [Amycolatopsis mediterranei]|uniref:hypothetical protein n=1 Tax=Amycolatopsis mediterranei TaxID=33910 RepID=UPI0034132D26